MNSPGGYDRGVRGSIASAPWEENAHARDSKKIRRETRSSSSNEVLIHDPPKRSCGCRETSSPPINRTEPKTPWGVPAAKVARASRERTRCGYTQFDWVADIGWTH
jgi:hypothetical protein